jgi:hypothetical protein
VTFVYIPEDPTAPKVGFGYVPVRSPPAVPEGVLESESLESELETPPKLASAPVAVMAFVPPLAIGSVSVTALIKETLLRVPPSVIAPLLVTVPVNVKPLTDPVPLTLVTVPALLFAQERIPLPLVVSAWPDAPSPDGRVHITELGIVLAALNPA